MITPTVTTSRGTFLSLWAYAGEQKVPSATDTGTVLPHLPRHRRDAITHGRHTLTTRTAATTELYSRIQGGQCVVKYDPRTPTEDL